MNKTGRIPYFLVLSVIAPAVAAGSSAVTPALVAPFDGKVSAVDYVPNADIAGANTNTRVLSLTDGADTLASLQFNSGVNAEDLVRKPLTLTAGDDALDVS